MATKTVGRIYLKREKDIIHILSVVVNVERGDIYFSTPTSNNSGIDSVKFSYHADGQTFINCEIPLLKIINDDVKRSITKGLGHNCSKVYSLSEKKVPLSEINGRIHAGNGMSYKDVNNINHDMFRFVNLNNIKKQSIIIDSRNYKDFSLTYCIRSPKISEKLEFGEIGNNDCLVFPHPSFDLSIIVVIADYFKEK